MKKRKKPIFLVALFVLLAGGVMAMNSNLLSTSKAPDVAENDSSPDVKKPPADAKKNTPPPDVTPTSTPDDSYVRPKSQDDPLYVNVKPIPAVKDGAPLISAPLDIKNKQRKFDRTSVQVQSGWYTKESGSNEEHHDK